MAGMREDSGVPVYNIIEELGWGQTSGCFPRAESKGSAARKYMKRAAELCLDGREGQTAFGHWTDPENEKYNEAWERFGPRWDKIASHVKSRTRVQVKSHHQKIMARQSASQQLAINRTIYSFLSARQATARMSLETLKTPQSTNPSQTSSATAIQELDAIIQGALKEPKLRPGIELNLEALVYVTCGMLREELATSATPGGNTPQQASSTAASKDPESDLWPLPSDSVEPPVKYPAGPFGDFDSALFLCKPLDLP